MYSLTVQTGYEPTNEDIAWAKMMVSLIKDGGVWGWPATGMVYRFDKQAKVLTLTNAELLKNTERPSGLSAEHCQMHNRTKAVFGAVGWEVKP